MGLEHKINFDSMNRIAGVENLPEGVQGKVKELIHEAVLTALGALDAVYAPLSTDTNIKDYHPEWTYAAEGPVGRLGYNQKDYRAKCGKLHEIKDRLAPFPTDLQITAGKAIRISIRLAFVRAKREYNIDRYRYLLLHQHDGDYKKDFHDVDKIGDIF